MRFWIPPLVFLKSLLGEQIASFSIDASLPAVKLMKPLKAWGVCNKCDGCGNAKSTFFFRNQMNWRNHSSISLLSSI